VTLPKTRKLFKPRDIEIGGKEEQSEKGSTVERKKKNERSSKRASKRFRAK
jgi:hypothetical protein